MTTKLHRNFIVLLTSSVLQPVISMGLVLAISRLQGAASLGQYSFVMAIFVIQHSCATFGLPVLITRDVAGAREQAGRYFVTSCVLILGILMPTLALALPLLRLTVAEGELAWAVGCILLATIPSAVAACAEAVLLAFERAGDLVTIWLVEGIARLVICTALVLSGHGIAAIAVTILVVRIAAGLAFAVTLRLRGVELSVWPDPRLLRDLMRNIPVVGSIPIVNAVYSRIDVFLIASLATWADVGLYSAGARLVDVARAIPMAYARALYPVLSRLRVGSDEEFVRVARRGLRDIALIVAFVTVILSGLARPVIELLYGAELVSGAPSLSILAWVLVPFAVATTLAQVLFAAGKQAIDLRVNLIATAAAVAANLALVPWWGATGAAVATLLASLLYATMQYGWVRRGVLDPWAQVYLAKLVTVAAGACLCAWLASDANLFLGALVGSVAYAAGLVGAGIVTRQDLDRVRLVAAAPPGRPETRSSTAERGG